MHFISTNYSNSDKLKGKEQDKTQKKLEVMSCCWLQASSKVGIFGVMTVKLEDAEHTPILISTVHPFCIMSASFGLRVWQGEGEFYLLGKYELENQTK